MCVCVCVCVCSYVPAVSVYSTFYDSLSVSAKYLHPQWTIRWPTIYIEPSLTLSLTHDLTVVAVHRYGEDCKFRSSTSLMNTVWCCAEWSSTSIPLVISSLEMTEKEADQNLPDITCKVDDEKLGQ